MYHYILEGKEKAKVLFLSEGEDGDVFGSHPLADKVASRMPNVECTQTDVSYDSIERRHKNVRKIKLDNSGDWKALEKEEFDIILMRHGICACMKFSSETCGGIPLNVQSLMEFLERVVKLLHKREVSMAVLQGEPKDLFCPQS